MSMAALRWIRPLQVTAPQKAVLWALADQADEAGEAWPSMAALVEATCLSERTVQAAVAGLRGQGLVSVTMGGGRHRTTLYRLAMTAAETPQDTAHSPRQSRGLGEPETPQILHETPQEVRKTPQEPRETPQLSHPNPQEPSRTLKEPSKRARAAAPVVALPCWLPAEAWEAWCQHRLAKDRKGWTHAAAVRCVSMLERLRDEGDDPVAVIDQAIAGGWTGLFPLKGRTGSGKAKSDRPWWMEDMLSERH